MATTSLAFLQRTSPVSARVTSRSYAALIVFVTAVALGAASAFGYGTIAVGLLVAAAGALVLADRPLLGAVVIVSAVPVLSGLNRGIPVPGLRLSEALIVGIAAVTLVAVKSSPWRLFDWVALIYVLCTLAFGLFDIYMRNAGLSLEGAGKLIGPLEFLLLYRVVLVNAGRPQARRTMLKWIMLASVPIALLAVMQFGNIPGTRSLASSYAGETDSLKSYNNTFYRATGLFAQGHLLGVYLMMIVLLGVALLFDSRPLPLVRRTLLCIVALDAVALGATATIMPILGAAAGTLMLAYWYRRLGRALAVAGIAAALGVVIFSSTIQARYNQQFSSPSRGQYAAEASSIGLPSTVAFRYEIWTHQYLPTIEQYPLTGYGPELPPGSVVAFTESAYVTLLLRGGLPLLGLFCGLLWLMARRSLRTADDRRPIARATFVAIIVLIIGQTQNNYLLDSGLTQLWWGLAGLLFAQSVVEKREPRSDSVREPRADSVHIPGGVSRT
jgi:hypothetical protein